MRLERLISRTDLTGSTPVRLTALPGARVAVYRTPTTATGIFADIPTGFARILEALACAGVEPAGQPLTVIHRVPDPDTPGDIAMCVPVAASSKLPGIDPGIALVDLPAGVAATVVHQGPYDDRGDAHASVSVWIHERGHRIVGPPREVYLNSPADADGGELRARILVPVEGER